MIRFKFKAYDNGWKFPMGFSLSLGITCLISAYCEDNFDEMGWFIVACLVVFIISKYMNYRAEIKEIEYIRSLDVQKLLQQMRDNDYDDF